MGQQIIIIINIYIINIKHQLFKLKTANNETQFAHKYSQRQNTHEYFNFPWCDTKIQRVSRSQFQRKNANSAGLLIFFFTQRRGSKLIFAFFANPRRPGGWQGQDFADRSGGGVSHKGPPPRKRLKMRPSGKNKELPNPTWRLSFRRMIKYITRCSQREKRAALAFSLSTKYLIIMLLNFLSLIGPWGRKKRGCFAAVSPCVWYYDFFSPRAPLIRCLRTPPAESIYIIYVVWMR